MKNDLDGKQREKKERLGELTKDLSRLETEQTRIVGDMERVTSKIGECRGMRSKFERDKKDLSVALVKTGRALGWEVDEVGMAQLFTVKIQIPDAHFFGTAQSSP
jgi:predicted nuclease with TOPRIM domain